MENSFSPIRKQNLGLRLATFFHALLFVIGFSLVFIVGWGGAATTMGQLFGIYKPLLGKIGGIVVIIFGLSSLRLIKIPWLYYDTRPQWDPNRGGWLSSVFMGVFFAAGWTPCIGTTLGAILTLSFSQQTAGQAMILTSGYAIGLGLPFLGIGLLMDRANKLVLRFRPYMRTIEIVTAGLMILIGILMLADRMTIIATWALRHGLFLDLPFGGQAAPTYFIAVIAGLLSFLSPCVLPLVPAYIGYLSSQALKGAMIKSAE